MAADAKGKAFAALRRRLPRAVKLWRIENSVGAGLPDVYGAVPGGQSFWVELKVGDLPKQARQIRDGDPVEYDNPYRNPLRVSQYATCSELDNLSVPVFVAFYRKGRPLKVYRFKLAFGICPVEVYRLPGERK